MAKIAIKSEKNHSFWRHIPNHGATFLPSLLYNWLNTWVEVQTLWLSIQRNHPLPPMRLFLRRFLRWGCHHPLGGSSFPSLCTCSADTILRAINELSQENISYTSDVGKSYDFNTADTLNILLLNCLLATGQLKEGEGYDVDFDHQFIETEKYDAKPTYKKFLGYRPSVAVIGDCMSLWWH